MTLHTAVSILYALAASLFVAAAYYRALASVRDAIKEGGAK